MQLLSNYRKNINKDIFYMYLQFIWRTSEMIDPSWQH